jgi:DNA-binding transcriptional LysR family regulator
MDRLEAMQVFTRVVERLSFAAAARDLGLPASTVSDAVKALEKRLGVRLIERTTRQVRPTADGEAYHRRCRQILADLEDAEAAFGGLKPVGPVRVEVQGSLARRVILPALPRFYADYPGIELRMSEGDRFVDVIREGVDCVLRVGTVREGDYVARPLGMLAEATFTSPGYIARFGKPERWDRLEGHRMVGFRSSATGAVLPLEFCVEGEVKTVMLPSALVVDGADTYREAARLGLGLIQAPCHSWSDDFRSGALVAVLEDTPPTPTPVSLLFARNRLMVPRVRIFLDWLTEEFRKVSAP